MRPTGRWALIVLAGALALAALNLWWVAEHRNGYPFDIDEAGYTTFALLEHFAWQSGGLDGWWDAVLSQAPQAPLVPALTSIVLEFKGGVLEGFAVLGGFLVLLALAVYGIGERLAGPTAGSAGGAARGRLARGLLLLPRVHLRPARRGPARRGRLRADPQRRDCACAAGRSPVEHASG